MSISFDTTSIYPSSRTDASTVLGHRRQINETDTGVAKVEDRNNQQQSSGISFRRELTPKEQQRVEFLKNLLVQTLTMAQGDPTEDQKKRIREIENELEKITGVKMRSRISSVTDKIPGKDNEDEEKEKQEQQAKGIDPNQAVHNNIDIQEQGNNPGMKMLQSRALFGRIQALMPMDFGSLGKLNQG